MVNEEEALELEIDTEEVEGAFRSAACSLWATEELEIDGDAVVSIGDEGAFVAAWVWVSNAEAGIDEEEGE